MRYLSVETSAPLAINSRYSCRITYPYVQHTRATLFQTVAMNNMLDLVTTLTHDLVVVLLLFPCVAAALLVPQVVWHFGYLFCNILYYMFSDLDAAMTIRGFAAEVPPAPDVAPSATTARFSQQQPQRR